MAHIREHYGSYQCLIRIKGHPTLAKSFKSKTDAKTWALQTELKIRREEAGILKIKYPSFKDTSLRYLNEVSIHKQKTTYNLERAILNPLMQEAWSEYPINKVTPLIIGRYRDKQREVDVANALKQVGGVRVRGCKVAGVGNNVNVWIIRNHDKYKGMTAKDLGSKYVGFYTEKKQK